MAETVTSSAVNLRKTGIFWNNNVSDDEQPLAFVPGVNGGAPFVPTLRCWSNRSSRRGSDSVMKSRSGKTSVKRAERTGSRESKRLAVSPEEESITMATNISLQQPQVSLKDLCPEDKKRIANLIQELARVSEEKEESALRLLEEQSQFEQKLLELEEQNILIAQERESLQLQYRECQELLGLYQLYLKQQQETLLLQPTTQQQCSHGAPLSAATAGRSQLDGSYLGLAPSQRPQQLRQTGVLCPAHARPAVSSVPARVPTPVPPPSCCCQSSEHRHRPHSSGSQRSHRSESASEDQRRSSPRCQRDPSPVVFTDSLAQGATVPPDVWGQRKNMLLLQKLQLEEERERLQRRLSEQEQRKNRELSLTENREDTDLSHRSREPITKRDAGTSPFPERSQQQVHRHQEARSDPETRSDPCPDSRPEPRLDASLSELLDIFSPICPYSKQKSATQRTRAAQQGYHSSGPAPCSLRSPACQDWEETQILEEIFFIC